MDHNGHPTQALCDAKFKDESPIRTVERIRAILDTYGIETEERWSQPTVPYCHSLRITVAGTTFGVNGKGVTREFARASGYGELMERLQLGFLGSSDAQKDGCSSVGAMKTVQVPAGTLLSENRSWYEALAREFKRYTGQEITPEQILEQYTGPDGTVTATPFYCVTTGKKAYFPTVLFMEVYITNGCAAGNTMEEAIVQGISETVERHHHIRILSDGITPPDIAEEVLQSCKVAYEIITFLRDKGFHVVVKDCSLGSRFPVICVCIIDRSTGRYHTHFGAAPVFEIALQRALTESFQGRSIKNIAKFDNFCAQKEDVLALQNLANELTRGESEKTARFFNSPAQSVGVAHMGFTGGNNRELLRECVAYFKELGCDILVRDCSCLGFPAYQILIPGYSESYCHRISEKHNDLRFWSYAKQVLRNPAGATLEELMGFMMHLAQMSRMPSDLGGIHGFVANAKIPAKLSAQEDSCLMAASLACVNYTLGRYSETVRYIDKMLSTGVAKNEEYLICVKRYLSFLINRCDKAEARAILEVFHNPGTVEKLYGCLARGGNPMEEFTLHCDGNCGGDCVLSQACCKRRVGELGELIRAKTRELDFDAMVRQLDEALEN